MEAQSSAPRIIESSRPAAGSKHSGWLRERSYLATKDCLCCGKPFSPARWTSRGREMVTPELAWSKREFCSISCARKKRNPMSKPESREKMRQALRRIGHAPKNRGGNGRPLPVSQLALLYALGQGWIAEHAVATKQPRGSGYPTNYKIDIANPEKMIGIEIDGGSHCTIERQEQDAKKRHLLSSQGWSIYHVSNQRALELYSTFTSADTLLTSLMES